MEVVDRYVRAVRAWLPRALRDEVAAELAEDLRSEIEDQEKALGRPLQESEMLAVLERRGHPLWVATPYLTSRPLIGPGLLGSYWKVLRIAVAGTWVVFAGLYLVFGVLVRDAAYLPVLRDPFLWLWQGVLYTLALAGLLTGIFALLERSQARARSLDVWDPRHPEALPRVPVDPAIVERRRLRSAAVGEAIGLGFFLLLWLGLWRLPSLPGVDVIPAPVWHTLFWPIGVVTAAGLALSTWTVLRPARGRAFFGSSLMRDLVALLLIAILLREGSLARVSVADGPPEAMRNLSRWLHINLSITLVAIGLSYLAGAVRDARGVLGKAPLRHWTVRMFAGS